MRSPFSKDAFKIHEQKVNKHKDFLAIYHHFTKRFVKKITTDFGKQLF